MNKNITVIVVLILVILTLGLGYSILVNPDDDNENTTSPTPTASATPTQAGTGDNNNQAIPLPVSEDWTNSYDGVLNFEFSYPAEWNFYPATNNLGESSITSFSIQDTPNTGGVPSDQIKIGITYFPADGDRNLTINESDVESEKQISVDGLDATRRVLSGFGGGSVSTTVETDDGTYLFSAYPPNSQLMSAYDHYLSTIEFNSTQVSIDTPNAGLQVSEVVEVEGEAPGNWFFEGVLSIRVETAEGEIIGEDSATSTENWMTSDSIPFSASIEIEQTESNRGNIVIVKNNPSGLKENELMFYWPIKF